MFDATFYVFLTPPYADASNAMRINSLECLPSSSVHVALESSGDNTRNAVVQPCLPE